MERNLKVYKIAVIPGDGTGPEVTAEAVKVLKATDIAALLIISGIRCGSC